MSVKVNTPTHTNYDSHAEYPVSSIINMETKSTSCQQQYSASRKKKRAIDKSPNNFSKRKCSQSANDESQFHLGGNINDPLNLNSMCDDEINKSLNEHTPYSSPLPIPTRRARVDNPLGTRKIDNPQCPTDFKNRLHFKDPLHLKSDLIKARNASKKLAMKNISQDGEVKKIPQSPIKQLKNKRVSIDVLNVTDTKASQSKVPDFTHKANNRQKDQRYQYGNYSRYYGYRTPDMSHDHRLDCLSAIWFNGAEVLDIGCNSGQVTLEIARKFNPSRIIGMDRDKQLIKTARKNVRSALSDSRKHNYPKSMPSLYGPLSAQPLNIGDFDFPHNVVFVEGNYVLNNDELLKHERPQYDTILALSITKWVHLNDGDEGLKRFFKRVFLQLKPSGKFILEPQSWPSYKHKKNLTPTIAHNFKNIKMKPVHFTEYLLSDEVGFSQCCSLDIPFNRSKGFRREMYVLTKPLVQRKSCIELLASKESSEDLNISIESNTENCFSVGSNLSVTPRDTAVMKEDESTCSPVVFTIGGGTGSDE